MPRADWPLRNGRPCVEIVLTLVSNGQLFPRIVLADTGAGSQTSGIDLILDEDDCLLSDGITGYSVTVGGAFVGTFPLCDLLVQVPALGFAKNLRVVGVPSAPEGIDGIACFSFLNHFHYGNFGDRSVFGLES